MRRNFSWVGAVVLGLAAACTARSDYTDPTTSVQGAVSSPGDAPSSSSGAPSPSSSSDTPASAPSSASATFPNTDDGKPIMQLGLDGIAYWSLEDKFLNLLQSSGYAWAAHGEWNSGLADMSFAELYNAGVIDKTTMLPTRLPAGYDGGKGFIASGLFRFGARYYPDYYAGTYVFDWQGDADARCGFGKPTVHVNAHRIECVYPANDTGWARVELTRIGAGFSNPRLYRKEDEAAINAGEIFSPKYVALLSQYKVLRMMDVAQTNTTWIRKVSELSTKQMFGWGSNPARNADAPDLPRGAPLALMVDLAVKTDTALWINVPPLLGAPDGIEDAQYQSDALAIRAFGQANFDAVAASPEWRNYADKVAAALASENYPKNYTLYQEIGNEIWNFANPFWRMTNYYWGMGDALKAKNPDASGESFRYALGWLTANYAVQFDAALRAAGRADQAWTIVLAGQHVYLGRTTAALQGAKDYFTANGLDPAVWMKKIGVSTATYYNGIYDLSTGLFPAADDAARDAQWLGAIASDPVGLRKRFADFMISGTCKLCIPQIVADRDAQKAEAEKFGATFVGDYEGNSHLVVPSSLKAEPAFIAWLRDFLLSDEAGRIDAAWAEALYSEDDKAMLANFVSVGPFVIDASGKFDPADHPWIDGFWTDLPDGTGRNRALKPFLRN
ncbi:MAG: hypothetical protein GC153_03140 [Alphaproteobacteria bacterium]|nr:hypothetical protein [Alphaproteobacteria bacterium]